jgi:hypothetical protein
MANKYLDLVGTKLVVDNLKNLINSSSNVVSFSMRIEDGNLICDYPDGTEEPEFSINDEGLLIYTYE